MKHFVEWDQLEIRVNGDKLNAFAQSLRVPPVERLHLHFQNGLLRVIGSVRKFVSVPFDVEIREIFAAGSTVKVPLRSISAFGGIPVPKFLFNLFKDKFPVEHVRYEEPATLVISLDRFLPTFVKAEIQHVWIIDGGLAVTVGRGGADLALGEEPGGTDRKRAEPSAGTPPVL